MFPLRSATAQYHQTACAVKSHSRALATFKIWYCAYSISLKTLHWLCVYGGAIPCALKQKFAQCKIFLEGTLMWTLPWLCACFVFVCLLVNEFCVRLRTTNYIYVLKSVQRRCCVDRGGWGLIKHCHKIAWTRWQNLMTSFSMLVTSQFSIQTAKISIVFWRALVPPRFQNGCSATRGDTESKWHVTRDWFAEIDMKEFQRRIPICASGEALMIKKLPENEISALHTLPCNCSPRWGCPRKRSSRLR